MPSTGYAGATLELLLRHRAGLDHEMNRNDRWSGWQRDHSGWFGRSIVIAPDPAEYGSRPFGAPAGFLRSSVPDLLRYVDFHIQGERGRGRLLQRSSFERLHRAFGLLQWASFTEPSRNPHPAVKTTAAARSDP